MPLPDRPGHPASPFSNEVPAGHYFETDPPEPPGPPGDPVPAALPPHAQQAADALLALISDDECTEVLLNGPNDVIKKVDGLRVHVASIAFGDKDTYHRVLNEVVLPLTDTVDRIDGTVANIEGQMEVPSGRGNVPPTLARCHMIAPPFGGVAVAKVTIAKKARYAFTLDTLPETGSMSQPMSVFLKQLVRARTTIVVSGPTGAGKCFAGDTPVRLADGSSCRIDTLVDPFVDASGTVGPDGVTSSPARFEVVAFRSEDAAFVTRPVHMVHRRPAPDLLMRVRLSTGQSLVCTPEHGMFALRAGTVTKVPARDLRPQDLLLAPAGRPGGLLAAEGVPVGVTGTGAWLVGAVLGVASRGVQVTAAGALVVPVPEGTKVPFGDATVALFGAAAAPVLRQRALELSDPDALAFLAGAGLLGSPVLGAVPGWLRDVTFEVVAEIASGLLDVAGSVASAREQRIDLRVGNTATAESLLALFQSHGMYGTLLTDGGAAGWSTGVRFSDDDALRLAKALTPRRPGLEVRLAALLAVGPAANGGLSADDQGPALSALVDELSGSHGVAGAYRRLAAVMSVSERTVRRYADGERAVPWARFTRIGSALPDEDTGPVARSFRGLALQAVVPVRVVGVDPVVNTGQGRAGWVYDLSVEDGSCAAFLAAGVAVSNSTVLEAMSHDYDIDERVVVVEDVRELQLPLADVTYLKSTFAAPGVDEKSAMSTDLLVRIANRMRVTRIIVGECRGPEFTEWLIAANSGADGSSTTVHADSPRRALDKMVSLGMKSPTAGNEQTLRRDIAATVDVIVQAGLVDNRHRILTIEEVSKTVRDNGVIATTTLFAFDRTTGKHVAVNQPSDELVARIRSRGASFTQYQVARR